MNRRNLLANVSAAAFMTALRAAQAQPLPITSDTVPPRTGPGPLSSKGVPWGASLDLSFTIPGTLDPRITFTRASGGTYLNSAGVMQSAAVNIALQSSTGVAPWGAFGNNVGGPAFTANAVVAPDGTTTATRLVYPAVIFAGSQTSIWYQNITATAAVYAFSVWLRGSVGGEQIYIGANTLGASYSTSPRLTLTTQWQRFTVVTSALTAAAWTFAIGTDYRDAGQASTPAQTIYAWGAQLELGSTPSPYIATTSAPNGAPRWDYNPSTLALQGLLIEEARTNLAFPSIPGSGWGILSGALTPASGIAPDGTNTMARLSEDGSNNFHLIIAPLLTIVAANVYTLSVFAKMQENRYLQLIVDDNSASGTHANFDLQTGSVTVPAVTDGSGSNVSSNIQSIGNGVYRCSIACATNTSTTGRAVLVLINTPTTPKFGTYQGNPANGLLVWGAQVEQGAFATSYIPTTAAAVTRAADSCVIPPASMGFYTPPGGSWMAEFIALTTGQSANLNIVGEQGTSQPTQLYLEPTSRVAQWDTSAVLEAVNGIVPGAVSKAASIWAPNTGGICVNGGAVASAALVVGYASAAGAGMGIMVSVLPNVLTGYIRRVRYWPRALSNAEMQQVTT